MKKLSLFLIIGLMFIMTACEKDIIEVEDDIDSEVDLHLTDIYEGEDDFIFLVNNSQSGIASMERYFQVEFTSLRYTPIKNEVCFSFDMTDEEFANATYYLILQEKGSMVTLQQMSFTLGSESTTNGGCFTAMSKEITYEILVGKRDRDDLNPTSYIDAVGSIEFKDPNFDERSKLGNISFEHEVFEHEVLEEYTKDHLPFIKYSLTIGDEDEIISDISIYVYEADFNILVKQIDYNITSDNRNNSNIILRNILIEDLAPNVEYIIYVKINGNDNISDFEDILIRNETVITPHITFGSGVSFHSLFIDIIDIEFHTEEVIVSYLARNDGNIISNLNNLPYDMVLKVMDSNGNEKYSTIVDPNESSLIIPIDMIEYGDLIQILSDRGNILFTEENVLQKPPVIRVSAIINGVFYVTIVSGIDSINFISFDILENENMETFLGGVGIESFESDYIKLETGIANKLTHYNSVCLFVNISYETTNGTMFYQEFVWVNTSAPTK